jgi:hypothetical protein
MTQIPPRLHALLASRAPLGVVFRRGPSKSACTLLWDRRTDEFRLGQWLKGRIYERRSDLSPEGNHLIYFAMNGKWKSDVKGAWTAISRAPYLKALALFPKGDCWHGGGLFTGENTYWLNDGYGHSVLFNTSEIGRDTKYRPSQDYGAECPGVYYLRLLRDGWRLVRRLNDVEGKDRDVFEKPAHGGWILRKIAHAEIGSRAGKGFYWDEHELVHSASELCIARPDWEWAEIDGERLVWAAGGKLFAAHFGAHGVAGECELFDFNGMTFERLEAPY